MTTIQTNINRTVSTYIVYAIEEQGALREYDSWSGLSMYLNEQLRPALNDCDIYSSDLHKLTSPYTAHVMTDPASIPVSMNQQSRNWLSTNPLFSAHLTSVVSQTDYVTMQGMPLSDIAVHTVMLHLLHLPYSGNAAYGEQDEGQVRNTKAMSIKVKDFVPRIGSVLSNGKFVFDAQGCGSQTFARDPELSRHYCGTW